MSRLPTAALSAVFLLGVCAGCAAKHRDAGFGEVQATIHDRSGFQAYWAQQAPEDRAVEETIRTLLAEEVTESSAVEIALLNNHRLQATFEELGIARADLLEARLIRNPVLGAEIRYPSRPIELSLTQSIMDLITLRRRKGVAAASFEAAKQRVADEVLRTIAEVQSVFYKLQAAEQTRRMRQSAVDGARAAAELAIRQHEAGNISDLDLENEQAMFAQAKLDLAGSEVDVLDERERLNRLLGVWGVQTTWRLRANLPELPSSEVDLEDVESLAVSRRLDLGAARHEVEAAARAVGLARPEAIGEILAGVHREREPGGLNTTGPAVDLPIPLFNRGRARRARAEAVFRQAVENYAALAVQIRSEVRGARDHLSLARSRAEYYKDVLLPRRERIVAFSQERYNFMLADVFQLLLAKQNEIAARGGYIEALRDYWIARVELERAAGGSLPPGEPDIASADLGRRRGEDGAGREDAAQHGGGR